MQRNCYIDPYGNPTVDPKTVDFKALVAAIPTAGEYYTEIKEDESYQEEVEKRIRKVIYVSFDKPIEILKKNIEETIAENQKRMDETLKMIETQIESIKSLNLDESMNENDENTLKIRNIEFTKIETVFKEKFKEMFENGYILKQEVKKLTQK
ncbi:hypothetical protein Hanom_Chr05g00411981 [Helianthus anomalus]